MSLKTNMYMRLSESVKSFNEQYGYSPNKLMITSDDFNMLRNDMYNIGKNFRSSDVLGMRMHLNNNETFVIHV